MAAGYFFINTRTKQNKTNHQKPHTNHTSNTHTHTPVSCGKEICRDVCMVSFLGVLFFFPLYPHFWLLHHLSCHFFFVFCFCNAFISLIHFSHDTLDYPKCIDHIKSIRILLHFISPGDRKKIAGCSGIFIKVNTPN